MLTVTAILDKKRWGEVFAGFEIIDVAIRDRATIQFCAKKSLGHEDASLLFDEDIASRIITLFPHRPAGNNCGFQELEGMRHPVLGVSRAPFPRPSGLISSRSNGGDVWPFGGGSGPMEQISAGRFVAPTRLKCIDGVTYAVGLGRCVFQRLDVGKWSPLENGFPGGEVTTKMGFSDIDAFTECDMYAVGGHGDVWHYNGTTWSQLGFPSNVQLATVTCAGDGKVYISGEGGSLWVGEKSTWKQIHQGASSLLWNDVLWFENKLWLASDYQFRQWDGKQLVPVEHEGKSVDVAGHLDAYDGVLVVASPNEAKMFDGSTWRTLVAPYV